MENRIIIGKSFGQIINEEIKNFIINYLYTLIDLTLYRYTILDSLDTLNLLKNNKYYVSTNLKGNNYFLILIYIENVKYSLLIDRKQLTYNKNNINVNKINIISLDLNFSDCLYNGTILDGKIINDNIFLFQDCLYLMKNDLTNVNMLIKLKYIDSIVKLHFRDNPYFIFKVSTLYKYNKLNFIINSINKLNYSSIIFYPIISGINIIFINNKTEYKNNYNNNNNNTTIVDPVKISDTSSYNIIANYCDYLKSRKYSYEYNTHQEKFWLEKSNIPDVYNISNCKYGEKLGIALIPNYKISQICENTIKINHPEQFICSYSNKFNKWIPISLIIN